jgi:lysozyme family protein
MAPTFQKAAAGYRAMWAKAEVRPSRKAAADEYAKKIMANRDRYKAIEVTTGVPWYMVGVIHLRESSMNFSRHLHNGDPLTSRTKQVPAGRPVKGTPPFTFEESAVDALTMPPHSLNRIKEWPIERVLYELEKYNGWGYLGKTNSPYLWSWTTEYESGKYVADHVFDPKAIDKQPGCVAILKSLQALLDTEFKTEMRPTGPTPLPKPEEKPSATPEHATATGIVATVLGLAAWFQDNAIEILAWGSVAALCMWIFIRAMRRNW